MGETKIEWADFSFNPVIGCTKVSPGCDHCYAETFARRIGQGNLWQGERRRTVAGTWSQPVKWNKKATALGGRYRVFCASLSDVFDNQWEKEWREDLFELISATPNLDWLLLTKRPQNIAKMLPENWDQSNGWSNVWLGTTVENQEEADRRIPHLLAVPARVHFLSCEPLLGPVDIGRWLHDSVCRAFDEGVCTCSEPRERHIGWVIAGGESGHAARPTDLEWMRSLRDQCTTSGVPFFAKQLSSGGATPIKNIDEFPADLQVREYSK